MKRLSIIFAAVLILALFVDLWMPVHGEGELYDKVIRLHVIANSDSEEDQALKYLVRDTVIMTVTPLVSELDSIEAVRERLSESLELIRERAEERVRAEGYGYGVTVTLTREEYPTKSYESVCFPSGEYISLQVKIGDAEGENWWCVLFPPLCLTAAQGKREQEEAFVSAGLTDEQYKVITETDKVKYRVRFKLLEVLQGLMGK